MALMWSLSVALPVPDVADEECSKNHNRFFIAAKVKAQL